MKNSLITLCLAVVFNSQAQQQLTGKVVFRATSETEALAGASIYWLNTSLGSTTDDNGDFSIPIATDQSRLVISYIGFKTDTLTISDPSKKLIHFMREDDSNSLDEITLAQRKKAVQKSYIETQNILTVNSAELLKAACCNLSESFETNPAIDVNFSDALTGTKQIKMLGLTSPYLLITEENIPMVRGASQAYGLTFTPGPWIESIQITKGAGSVVNGFESIAGQINTELQKPFTATPRFINLFRSANGRMEFNGHLNSALNDKWHAGLYLHGNQRNQKMDQNKDGFLDAPLAQQFNILNRWQYTDAEKGWVGFVNLRFMNDEKQVGQVAFDPQKNNSAIWGSEIKTRRWDTAFKMGYVIPEIPYTSFGFQGAYSQHDQEAYFGNRRYDILQDSGFVNLLYNSIIGNTNNTFKSGINFSYDRYQERVDTKNWDRIDRTVAAFFEYSYDNKENFSWVGGLRIDQHNNLGTFLTPRMHLRYLPDPKTILRASVGAGRKAANIFAENQTLFGTNRTINIQNTGGSIYGLDPEKAWNYGLSLRKILLSGDQNADITIDYYITQFDNQVVVDWERPTEISFYNLDGKSRANSLQISFDYAPSNTWSYRFAYKNYDVKTAYRSGFLQRPLQAQHRYFANVGWESIPTDKGKQWRWDFTYHGVGKQRVVAQNDNMPSKMVAAYALLNSQLTRAFSADFEIYAGLENIGNYTQANPIIEADNPFANTFDTAQVYAPVFGRMIYTGLRWNL